MAGLATTSVSHFPPTKTSRQCVSLPLIPPVCRLLLISLLSLTSGGLGSIGSDFDRSPAIMVVDDALDEATRVVKGTDGAMNAPATDTRLNVAAISNFMVVVEFVGFGTSYEKSCLI